MSSLIHWHEGLFLQPHHLQSMQRSFFEAGAGERKLNWAYPYGVVEARLSNDELENFRVRFDRLKVVMPSGQIVDFPNTAEIPPLDIKGAFGRAKNGFTISLALPLWDRERANSMEIGQVPDPRVKLLYRLKEVDRKDENTGENAKPLIERRLNARLVLEDEDTSELETLPLIRIVPATGEDIGLPKLDAEFAPPCMILNGSAVLRELTRDLVSQVEASRKELVVQINQGGFNMETLRGTQFDQLFRLRTLNRYSASLPALAEAPNATPFQMYLEFYELFGELMALHPDRDEFDVAPYTHDNPLLAFRELSRKIRGILKGVVTASFIKVDFQPEGDFHAATFTDEHFTKPNDYYLCVKTHEDPRALTALVEDGDRFKFMAKSLATRPIRGIKLKEERIPPQQLPAQTGMHYYHVLRNDSGRMWQMLQREKAASMRWPGMENSDFQITLYMTVPGGD